MNITDDNKAICRLKLRTVLFVSIFAILGCGGFSASAKIKLSRTSKCVCPNGSEGWSASTDCSGSGGTGLKSVVIVGGVTLYPPPPSTTDGDMSASGTATAPTGGWTPGVHGIEAKDNCGKVASIEFIVAPNGVSGVTASFDDVPTGKKGWTVSFTLSAVCTDNTPVTVLGSINWTFTGTNPDKVSEGNCSGASGSGITVVATGFRFAATYTGPCNGCQKINWIQTVTACNPPPGPSNPWGITSLPLNDTSHPPYYYPANSPPTAKCDCN